MAIRAALCALLAVAFGATANSCWATEPTATLSPSAGTCLAEQAKPDPDGASAEAVALRFVQALSAGDAAGVGAQMTTAGRASATDAQIAATLKGVQALGVDGQPTLSKAYILNLNPAPTAISRVPCMSPAPDAEMDFVAVGPAAKQAHVLFTAPTNGEGVVTYVIWLQVEEANWRIAAFWVSPSQMAGRSGVDWWEIAKKQRQERHDFNAALIYETAQSLLDRGPNYQGPMILAVMSDARTLTPPKELSGQFPLTWSMDGKTFKVVGVRHTGTSGGRSVLAIVQLSDFTSNEDADRQNHLLIDAFNKTHPEWREVFDWLASKTCKPDGSLCFGSVYERKSGYLKGPPS